MLPCGLIFSKMFFFFTFNGLNFSIAKFVRFVIAVELHKFKFNVLFCLICDKKWPQTTTLFGYHVVHKHVCFVYKINVKSSIKWVLFVEINKFGVKQFNVIFMKIHFFQVHSRIKYENQLNYD